MRVFACIPPRPAAIVFALAALLSSQPLRGQLNGPAFRVNTATTGAQSSPVVAGSASGFVVSWRSGSYGVLQSQRYSPSGAPQGGETPISFQGVDGAAMCADAAGVVDILWTDAVSLHPQGVRIDAAGAPHGYFSVGTGNDYSSGGQLDAACTPGGAFVVSWGFTGEYTAVSAQRFSSAGAALGNAVKRIGAAFEYSGGSLGTDSAGNFVFVYSRSSVVFGQRYAANGSSLSTEFRVDTQTSAATGDAQVAMAADGAFTVVWPAAGPQTVARHYDKTGAPSQAFRVNETPSSGGDLAVGPRGDTLVLLRGGNPGVRVRYYSADGTPNGGEVTVSATGTAQTVTSDGQGQFLVTWTASDGDGDGVFARRTILPLRQLSSEFRVNTVTTLAQAAPSVAQAVDGGFLVVWRHDTATGSNILAQRYSPAAAPIGGEFRVNATDAGSHLFPSAAAISAGGYVVAWKGDGAEGSAIYARRIDGNGAALGSEFRINATTTNAGAPHLAADAVGAFVAAFSASSGGSGGVDVFARRFSSAGAPVGGEFRVNTATADTQDYPSIAASPNGDFVVVWQSSAFIDHDVFGQRFSASGTPLGGEFRVSASTNFSAVHPAVAADAQGGFVVSWDGDSADGSGKGIVARRYSSAGAPLTAEFRVNSYTSGDQTTPVVSYDASGGLTFVWNSVASQDGSNGGIYARRFTKTGEPFGDDFRVNTYTPNDQRFPSIAGGRNLVVAWASEIQDGSGDGVYAQAFRAPCRTSDANGDAKLDVADVFYLINYLFAGGAAPSCGGDANGDAQTNVADVFYLINYLFAGGAPPA